MNAISKVKKQQTKFLSLNNINTPQSTKSNKLFIPINSTHFQLQSQFYTLSIQHNKSNFHPLTSRPQTKQNYFRKYSPTKKTRENHLTEQQFNETEPTQESPRHSTSYKHSFLKNKKMAFKSMQMANKIFNNCGRFEIIQLHDGIVQILDALAGLKQYQITPNQIRESIKDACQAAINSQNKLLIIYSLLHLSKISLILSFNYDAFFFLKLAKRKCTTQQDIKIKQQIYKTLGKLIAPISFKIALLYFTKYLQTSWILKDSNSELKAYDLIGLLFFNNGDSKKAAIFHKKMTENQILEFNSPQRKLGEKKFIERSLGIFPPTQTIYQQKADIEIGDLDISSDKSQLELLFEEEKEEIKIKKIDNSGLEQLERRKLGNLDDLRKQGNKNIYSNRELKDCFQLKKVSISRSIMTHHSRNRNLQIFTRSRKVELEVEIGVKQKQLMEKRILKLKKTLENLIYLIQTTTKK